MKEIDSMKPRWVDLMLVLLALLSPYGYGGEAATQRPASAEAEEESVLVVFAASRDVVLSSRVASVVTSVRRELGQSFGQGETLVEMDDAVYRARVAKMRALHEEAKVDLAAKEKLFADRTLALTELQAARTRAEVAGADLAAAMVDLDACVVQAPFQGRVADVRVREHESVRPGQELIEIIDDRVLYASFLAPAKALVSLRQGQTLTFRVEETGEMVDGRVSHIGAVINPVSSTVKVQAEVKNSEGKLRAGMRGSIPAAHLVVFQTAPADRPAGTSTEPGPVDVPEAPSAEE